MLDVVVEGWKYLIKVTGLPIDPGPAALVTIAIVVTGKALLAMRRSRREFHRIAQELKKSTEVISGHMRTEFDGQVEKMNKLQANVQRTLNRRIVGVHEKLEVLQELMRPTEAVTSLDADSEIREDVNGDRELPRTRLGLSESVRSAVMEKWLQGMSFVPSSYDPNVYDFEGHSESGNDYRIALSTPYRASLGRDGRLPFALEIWVNGRKHLNFEWDSEGKYALRGFKKGEWIEDVAEWRLIPGQAREVA